ncbi:MAG: CPCC family cysteine-rich protein [Pseudomonas sp.]
MSELLPCQCCGSLTISEYGKYEICPICNWEDDPVQSENPDYSGGANALSLSQARENWKSEKILG